MTVSRAYFTGMGLHTSLGRGVAQNIKALRESIVEPQQVSLAFGNRVETVPYHLLADEPLVDIEHRFYRILVAVIEEALYEARLSMAERRQLSLFIGTSSSDISVSEAIFKNELLNDSTAQPLISSSSLGNVALSLMKRFDLRGADFSINTACTASANALMHADAMIRSGKIERALVVGFEFCNRITALGFQGLQLLTSDVMRPFDARRKGLVLGEACAALVLEKNNKQPAAFYLRGAANVCDTHSISAANPDGSTIERVIKEALLSANVSPDAINAIKAHGTASLLNDEAEVTGMRRAFDQLPTLCALKPRIGHTLGACGLNELLLFVAAVRAGWLPGTPGICDMQSDLGVTLNQAPTPIAQGNFMLNYFGFGGNNTSLIVSNRDT